LGGESYMNEYVAKKIAELVKVITEISLCEPEVEASDDTELVTFSIYFSDLLAAKKKTELKVV
jgi:hypothetical protein